MLRELRGDETLAFRCHVTTQLIGPGIEEVGDNLPAPPRDAYGFCVSEVNCRIFISKVATHALMFSVIETVVT